MKVGACSSKTAFPLFKIEPRENANASGQIFVINIDFSSPPFGIWTCYRERIEP
jgi:hypothetical protein